MLVEVVLDDGIRTGGLQAKLTLHIIKIATQFSMQKTNPAIPSECEMLCGISRNMTCLLRPQNSCLSDMSYGMSDMSSNVAATCQCQEDISLVTL